jgi:hypothetical protein
MVIQSAYSPPLDGVSTEANKGTQETVTRFQESALRRCAPYSVQKNRQKVNEFLKPIRFAKPKVIVQCSNPE